MAGHEHDDYHSNISERDQRSLGTNDITKHYEAPNISHILYDYTNKEVELIKKSFRPGNYNSLRDLPNDLNPNSINSQMRQKIEHNLHSQETSTSTQKKRLTSLWGGGYYKEFEWMPAEYEAYKELQHEDRVKHDEKRKKISEKDFVAGRKITKHKWEDPFDFRDEVDRLKDPKPYLYPFHKEDDHYEASKDHGLRLKWMEESKLVAGDFKPSSNNRSLAKANKTGLPDIVNYIREVIQNDWEDADFLIGTNPDDNIEVKFEMDSLDSLQGLHAYMNILFTKDDQISGFGLRRVIQNWGVTDNQQYVFYMLAPPWSKLKIVDTYYTLHPDEIPRHSVAMNSFYRTTMESKDSEKSQGIAARQPQLYSIDIDVGKKGSGSRQGENISNIEENPETE